jgi:hypothetical protein
LDAQSRGAIVIAPALVFFLVPALGFDYGN